MILGHFKSIQLVSRLYQISVNGGLVNRLLTVFCLCQRNCISSDAIHYTSLYAVRPNITSINQTVGGVERQALFHQGMLTLDEFTPQLELTCEAYGTPPPEIVWLNNGIALQNILNRRTITVEDGGSFGELGNITHSTLRLSEVQLSDAGEYTCRAISGNVSPIPGTTTWTFLFAVTGESLTLVVRL